MASLATRIPTCETSTGLSEKHLDSLAETYDRVPVPVWIYDLWNRCVYRNRLTKGLFPEGRPRIHFDIVNERDQIVGRLATIER